MKRFLLLLALFALSGFAEMDSEGAAHFNTVLSELKGKIREKFSAAQSLSRTNAPESEFEQLLSEVRLLKEEISSLEENWRTTSVKEAEGDPYALWDIGETTISQLVMEYGTSDYLYTVPPELASMKISLYTSIPLPRESWSEMIEAILAHNGVGVKKINAYVKQLYIMPPKSFLAKAGAMFFDFSPFR